jgi:hypothetical protein
VAPAITSCISLAATILFTAGTVTPAAAQRSSFSQQRMAHGSQPSQPENQGSIGKAQARRMIEDYGYKDVKNIKKVGHKFVATATTPITHHRVQVTFNTRNLAVKKSGN